jgi:hypothetical protein
MEGAMSEPITIVDTETEAYIIIPDYKAMTIEELIGYAALGRDSAIEEILRREPRFGEKLDPYSPVTLPET